MLTSGALARWLLLVIGMMLWGMYRASAHHPGANHGYGAWLSNMPWTWRDRLPFGSVYPGIGDLLLVGIVILIGYLTVPVPPAWREITRWMFTLWIYPVAFLAGYVLALIFVFIRTSQLGYAATILYTLPLMIFPRFTPWAVIAVLGFSCLIGTIGIRQYLKGFPWKTEYWQNDSVGQYLKEAFVTNIIPPPYSTLHSFRYPVGITLWRSLVMSALPAWWLVILFYRFNPPLPIMSAIIAAGIIYPCLYRFILYLGNGFPPISFLGRIATRQWIVPRYDCIFVAPICSFLIASLGPQVLKHLGLSNVSILGVVCFLSIFTLLIMPPRLERWKLTGAHRIFTGGTRYRQVDASIVKKRLWILRTFEKKRS